MRQIAELQAQMLIFIENFIQGKGYSPSIKDIADRFKMSTSGAHYHVLDLLKKGCIEHLPGNPRTIRLRAKKQGVGA